MKSLETVYNELEELLIKKLPEYIEKINKQHNDGLILKPFENTSLDENCIKQPSFNITFTDSEYSEKDRIIENTVFTVSLEIKLPSYSENKIILLYRYVEAVQKMFNEEEKLNQYEIIKIKENKIFIRINN